jgi:hypothetical protein
MMQLGLRALSLGNAAFDKDRKVVRRFETMHRANSLSSIGYPGISYFAA